MKKEFKELDHVNARLQILTLKDDIAYVANRGRGAWIYIDDLYHAEPKFVPREEWRGVPGYESLYQVSNMGNVKSLPKEVTIPNGNKVIKKEK